MSLAHAFESINRVVGLWPREGGLMQTWLSRCVTRIRKEGIITPNLLWNCQEYLIVDPSPAQCWAIDYFVFDGCSGQVAFRKVDCSLLGPWNLFDVDIRTLALPSYWQTPAKSICWQNNLFLTKARLLSKKGFNLFLKFMNACVHLQYLV